MRRGSKWRPSIVFCSVIDDGALVYIYGEIKIRILVHLLPHYFLFHGDAEFNPVSGCQSWKWPKTLSFKLPF